MVVVHLDYHLQIDTAIYSDILLLGTIYYVFLYLSIKSFAKYRRKETPMTVYNIADKKTN